MCAALLRVLVISGPQVLLKLCFQVFIVLSPADEAGPAVCTRVHGGGAVLLDYRVVFSGPCIWLIVRTCSDYTTNTQKKTPLF